jgi:hypothetical protein
MTDGLSSSGDSISFAIRWAATIVQSPAQADPDQSPPLERSKWSSFLLDRQQQPVSSNWCVLAGQHDNLVTKRIRKVKIVLWLLTKLPITE